MFNEKQFKSEQKNVSCVPLGEKIVELLNSRNLWDELTC